MAVVLCDSKQIASAVKMISEDNVVIVTGSAGEVVVLGMGAHRVGQVGTKFWLGGPQCIAPTNNRPVFPLILRTLAKLVPSDGRF